MSAPRTSSTQCPRTLKIILTAVLPNFCGPEELEELSLEELMEFFLEREGLSGIIDHLEDWRMEGYHLIDPEQQ